MNNFHEKSIIHISFDFPDSIDSKKPKAVANLINSQKKNQNIIFSLNRTSNPFDDFSYLKEDQGYSLKIFGLPYGIGLSIWMYFAYKRIYKIIESEKIDSQLIHAHKLTFEGLIAFNLSKKLSRPYIITVRGHTDIKVINHKKMLKNKYLRIIQNSQKIIYLAPWTEKIIQRIFRGQIQNNNSSILPNIIDLYKKESLTTSKNNRFITVFNLDFYKIKNIKRTINAIDLLHCKYPEIALDIVGGGNSLPKIQSLINKCKYPHRFRLLGAKDHVEVLNLYQSYLGFILPSYPETFGMVYIEALNSGIPIIYSKNSGVDGYFDNEKVGEKVNHRSTSMIAEAILKIFHNNDQYSLAVMNLKKAGGLDKFSKESITFHYDELLAAAM